MKLVLRRALPADFSALEELVQAYYAFDDITFSPAVSGGIKNLLADERFGFAWFFEVDGSVAGYGVLTRGFDFEFGGEISLLTDFFFLEAFRGRGLGALAIAEIVAFARSQEFGLVELFTTPDNERARRLYAGAGFVRQQRVPMFIDLRQGG